MLHPAWRLAIPVAFPFHKHPFHRTLIVQEMAEGLTLVTIDREIPHYGLGPPRVIS